MPTKKKDLLGKLILWEGMAVAVEVENGRNDADWCTQGKETPNYESEE